jgi:hypothetical protein
LCPVNTFTPEGADPVFLALGIATDVLARYTTTVFTVIVLRAVIIVVAVSVDVRVDACPCDAFLVSADVAVVALAVFRAWADVGPWNAGARHAVVVLGAGVSVITGVVVVCVCTRVCGLVADVVCADIPVIAVS